MRQRVAARKQSQKQAYRQTKSQSETDAQTTRESARAHKHAREKALFRTMNPESVFILQSTLGPPPAPRRSSVFAQATKVRKEGVNSALGGWTLGMSERRFEDTVLV